MAEENGEDTLVLMNKVKLAYSNSSLPSRSLSKEELWKLEHEKLHAKHKGHEAMHMEMVLILFSTLIVAQVLLVKWKKHYYKSFQAVTLVGMWLIPLYFNIKLQFWRMLSTWTLFSTLTGFIVYKSTRQPLSLTTPRNLALVKRTRSTLKLTPSSKYTSKGGLPSRSLDYNICAVCGLELALQQGHDDDDPLEKTYKLSCGHLFHEFCIRGWCIVGKKQTCPYCKEKVDLKRMFCNPWERPHVLFGQLLDWIRYLVVWQPIIIVVVQIIIYLLGLE
ncbi:E3 ubiquitin ligase RNF121-like isoform X3 [Acropora palmata]|uniref:E3 ubiquitin ligase RNF121-like isoform X3 n=1 Tax=Acropora palmata TaxID=6131 RepID=UPI003DA0F31A